MRKSHVELVETNGITYLNKPLLGDDQHPILIHDMRLSIDKTVVGIHRGTGGETNEGIKFFQKTEGGVFQEKKLQQNIRELAN